MNVLYFIIPLALLISLLFIMLFFWAVSLGQYDDLDSPAYKILLDDITKDEIHADKK